MNTLSFKSTFRPVKGEQFTKLVTSCDRKFISLYPWTIKESVSGTKAMTTDVFDCSVFALSDGVKVFLMHLCPTIEENLDFGKIENFILKKNDIKDKNLQAVLIGSQSDFKLSKNLYNFLADFVEKHNIPCSFFKHCKDYFNIHYSSITDEWSITSLGIDADLTDGETDNEKVLNKNFKYVKLSSFDEFA